MNTKKKRGPKKKPANEKRTEGTNINLRLSIIEHETLMEAKKDLGFTGHKTDFVWEMINKGIQFPKEITTLEQKIKKLVEENNHLKNIKEIVVGGNLLWDIMEYLFPESPSAQQPIWREADLHKVLPRYSVKQINCVFASNQDIFEYIPKCGWRLINELEYLN